LYLFQVSVLSAFRLARDRVSRSGRSKRGGRDDQRVWNHKQPRYAEASQLVYTFMISWQLRGARELVHQDDCRTMLLCFWYRRRMDCSPGRLKGNASIIIMSAPCTNNDCSSKEHIVNESRECTLICVCVFQRPQIPLSAAFERSIALAGSSPAADS
jgi:hypothetical protein